MKLVKKIDKNDRSKEELGIYIDIHELNRVGGIVALDKAAKSAYRRAVKKSEEYKARMKKECGDMSEKKAMLDKWDKAVSDIAVTLEEINDIKRRLSC